MPTSSRKKKKSLPIEVEHVEGAARVLEIGASLQPQAHLLWHPPSTVEYLDLPAHRNVYDGSMDIEELYKPLYKEVTEIYKGKKVYFGNAADLGSYVTGKFDVIFASHVLEHFPWHMIDAVLEEWVSCLAPGGALHILVPSLEWCAEEALSDTPSMALLPVLCGGQVSEGDAHLAMFTMRYLRARLEKAGLSVMNATTGTKMIHVGDGETVETDQHYAIGLYLPKGTELPPLQKE